MSDYVSVDVETTVALRKESVDRNNASPTARVFAVVALRKESVDRNLDYCDDEHTEWSGRSPQGERG